MQQGHERLLKIFYALAREDENADRACCGLEVLELEQDVLHAVLPLARRSMFFLTPTQNGFF